MITTWLCHQIINLEDLRVSTTCGTLYLAMELMECDLQRILASGQVLSVENVKVILKQLLLGVQAMHHNGILRERSPLQFFLSFSSARVRASRAICCEISGHASGHRGKVILKRLLLGVQAMHHHGF